jgi:hypothetical protein
MTDLNDLNILKIVFEDEKEVFRPGTTINGLLLANIADEKLKINSVKVRIKGYAQVSFSETLGTGNLQTINSKSNKKKVEYQSSEEYLNVNFILLPEQANDLYLERGNHTYPFQIRLPDTLPTSFEHEYGSIRYSLIGTIHIPWATSLSIVRNITVISPYDLSKITGLKLPIGVSENQVTRCLCLNTKPNVSVKFSIKQTGFVCGEPIEFHALICNTTTDEIKNINSKLIQIIEFKTPAKTSKHVQTIKSIDYESTVSQKATMEWDSSMIIPVTEPSSIKDCKIINISYHLELNFDTVGSNQKFQLDIPVEIGTDPIQEKNTFTSTYKSLNYRKTDNDQIKNMNDNNAIDKYTPSYIYYNFHVTENEPT